MPGYRPSRAAPDVAAVVAGKAIDEQERAYLRQFIAVVGAETRWRDDTHNYQLERVPFDEPVLGIVGMWRYGGGANPHFSLALAETMLRVGQRHIAWSAYERTRRL